ncbi:GATA zinc finger domain-containing protein 8-like [Physella acuta]|uniref:GATA zinc finger domain-containing protein 8-like n=1 Tax=Physella acuta TaxID=109671 RepID=UPI0027DBCCBD|nr:GATA zinc finger domain-containing protein 8-like [Physella acuta]
MESLPSNAVSFEQARRLCARLGDGHVHPVLDCTRFIKCVQGRADLQRCPRGLYFNPLSAACDALSINRCSEYSRVTDHKPNPTKNEIQVSPNSKFETLQKSSGNGGSNPRSVSGVRNYRKINNENKPVRNPYVQTNNNENRRNGRIKNAIKQDNLRYSVSSHWSNNNIPQQLTFQPAKKVQPANPNIPPRRENPSVFQYGESAQDNPNLNSKSDNPTVFQYGESAQDNPNLNSKSDTSTVFQYGSLAQDNPNLNSKSDTSTVFQYGNLAQDNRNLNSRSDNPKIPQHMRLTQHKPSLISTFDNPISWSVETNNDGERRRILNVPSRKLKPKSDERNQTPNDKPVRSNPKGKGRALQAPTGRFKPTIQQPHLKRQLIPPNSPEVDQTLIKTKKSDDIRNSKPEPHRPSIRTQEILNIKIP